MCLLLSYRACYRICNENQNAANCECKRQLNTQDVMPLVTQEGGPNIKKGRDVYTLYTIQTPLNVKGLYPNNRFCTYSLIPRKLNHQFCYIFSTPQPFDLEESREQNQRCEDSMEFEHRDTQTGEVYKLVHCGTEVDHRLDDGASTLSDVELTFKSDDTVRRKGTDFRIAEFPVNVSLYV